MIGLLKTFVQRIRTSLCGAIDQYNNHRMCIRSRQQQETTRDHLKIRIIRTPKINNIRDSHQFRRQISIGSLVHNSAREGLLKIYQTRTKGKVYLNKKQAQSDNSKTITHSRLINKYINAGWSEVAPDKKEMNLLNYGEN